LLLTFAAVRLSRKYNADRAFSMVTNLFPFVSIGPGKDGAHRLGWVDLEVEIPEIEAGAFRMAACEGQWSYPTILNTTYVADNAFWKAVTDKGDAGDGIDPGDVLRERRFDFSAGRALYQARVIARSPLRDRQCSWNLPPSQARRIDKGLDTIKHSFREDEIDERDAEFYRAWASTNLLLCEGRLLQKVNSPGCSIMDSYAPGRAGGPHGLTLRKEAAADYGSGLHGNGVHFEWPQSEMYELQERAVMHLGAETVIDRHDADFGKRGRVLEKELERAGVTEPAVVFGNTAFFPDVISSVSERQTMEERSVLGTVGSIARMSQPHLFRQGRKRDVLFAIREHFNIPPSSRNERFVEVAAELIEELPLEDAPARQFFKEAVLERWNDREIVAAPMAANGMAPGARGQG
jgi:hypothetical protein